MILCFTVVEDEDRSLRPGEVRYLDARNIELCDGDNLIWNMAVAGKFESANDKPPSVDAARLLAIALHRDAAVALIQGKEES